MGKHSDISNKSEQKQSQNKKSKNKRNYILILIQIIGIALIIYSIYHVYKWYVDSENSQKEAESLSSVADVTEMDDDKNIKIVDSDEDKSNPYWDYIKMKLINVDFSELEKINSDVAGWIQVNGTNINYPFVQTTNNDYYLTRSFSKNYNEAGWVFLDYRNNVNKLDRNTIIYAHSRLDRTMFGSLKNLLQSDWYNNKNNHIIKISTKSNNTLWQVFSVYHIPTTSDYLRTKFKNDEDFKSFAKKLKDRSVYDFDATINDNDKILTLSTCYRNNQKMVMHAKLIKYSNK